MADLTDIRVVAVEQAVAAPLCTRHLADLGADVIKVEKPGTGDFARYYDDAVLGEATHFVWLNRGKRSVVLDLKSDRGVEALRALLARSDVLVCNMAPGAFDRIILDTDLEQSFPRLIRCYISGYGTTGPYATRKAYDLLVQAEAGTIAATGTPDVPAKPGVSLADLAGGVYALAAINAALVGRDRTGQGRRIDVALFDVLLEWMSPLLLAQLHTGAAPEPAGLRHASITPYGPFVTADGEQIMIAVQNDGQWRRLCEIALDAPELFDEPELATNTNRIEHRDRTESEVQRRLGTFSTAEATARLNRADVPSARLNQIPDVVAHSQARATGRWSTAELPDGRQVSVVTTPLHPSSASPDVARIPRLGEHTAEVLEELGLDTDEPSG